MVGRAASCAPLRRLTAIARGHYEAGMRPTAPRPFACLAVVVLLASAASAQTPSSFDVFDVSPPPGFRAERTEQSLAFKQDDGVSYAHFFLFKARASAGSARADFAADWQSHAKKHGLAKPAQQQTGAEDGWEATVGTGVAQHEGQPFYIVVTTVTGRGLTYAVVGYFNDESFADAYQAFSDSVNVNPARLAPSKGKGAGTTAGSVDVGPAPVQQPPERPAAPPAGAMVMAKFNTNFDDGWHATVKADWVEVTRAGDVEVRLYYPDDQLENARPREVDAPEWFWGKLVQPGFDVPRPEKWAGVQYPVIYFMEGAGTDRRTGAQRYVAMKVIFEGGAHVVVALAPTKAAYQALFGHPNDLNKMLGYNKFGLTAKDLVGTWARGGGGGVEYYNAYTGSYAGMSAISATDEFTFTGDGAYSSSHRAANTANGNTRFSGTDFKGRFTVTEWAVTATNREGGRTKKFNAQLEAVKRGYLLHLSDSDEPLVRYVLFRRASR